MTKKKVKRLQTKINHCDGISQRALAEEFDFHQRYVERYNARPALVIILKKGTEKNFSTTGGFP